MLTGPGLGDGAFGVQLGLAVCLAPAGVGRAVAEAVEAGVAVRRVTVQAGADVGVDVVGAVARFDRQELPPWQVALCNWSDLPEHQPIVRPPLRIRLHIPDHTVPQVPLPRFIPQRMMPVRLSAERSSSGAGLAVGASFRDPLGSAAAASIRRSSRSNSGLPSR